MKKNIFMLLLPAFLAWSAGFEAMQQNAEQFLETDRIKDARAVYKEFSLVASQDEMGAVKAKMAIAYYRDQEHEQAFKTFLEALDTTKTANHPKTSTHNYEEALKIYLDDAGHNNKETAKKILSQFESIYKSQPEDDKLGYLIAMSKANLGQFQEFFDIFYLSYLHDPDHFLAYKAKAVMHIKLFERAKSDGDRQKERQLVIVNAERAVALEPHDTSLYRMILGFTPEESKGTVLSTHLNKIIDQNIVLSRIDIPYYVEIAIAFKQYDLAQNFLNKAKEWYQYSRVIETAQKLLNQDRTAWKSE